MGPLLFIDIGLLGRIVEVQELVSSVTTIFSVFTLLSKVPLSLVYLY
jgi:hypothetical protein